jgi:hypothetical protein
MNIFLPKEENFVNLAPFAEFPNESAVESTYVEDKKRLIDQSSNAEM